MKQRRGRQSPVQRILTANILVQFLGLSMTLSSAALLGVSEFGQLTAVILWLSFLTQILNFGVPDTMVAVSRSQAGVAQVYRNGIAISLVAGLICSVILAVVALMGVFSVTATGLAAASVIMLLTLLSGCVASLEQRLSNFGVYNRLMVLTNIVSLTLLVPAVVIQDLRTVDYVIWSRALGLAVPVAVGIIRQRARIIGPPDSQVMPLFRKAVAFHVTGMLNAFSARADQLVASALLSHFYMGILGLVLPFSQAVKSVPSAFSTVGLVQVVEETQPELKLRRIRKALRNSAIASCLGALVASGASVGVLWLQSHWGSDWVLTISTGATAFVYMGGAAVGGVVDLLIRLHRGVDVLVPGIVARTVSAIFGLGSSIVAVYALGIIGAGVAFMATSLVALAVLFGAQGRAFKRKGLA